MAKPAQITSKNFASTLSTYARSGESLRQRTQDFIVFGLSQLKEHGDTGYLSRFMAIAVKVNAIRTSTVKDFIKGHATNLKYGKTTDGSNVFMKDDSNKKIKVTMPTANWWEWNNAGKAVADMDVIGQVKSLLSRIQAAEKDHKIKAEQTEFVGEAKQALNLLLNPPKKDVNQEEQEATSAAA